MNYNVKIYKNSYLDKRLKLEYNKYGITLEELKKGIIKRYGNLFNPSSYELKQTIYKAKDIDELEEFFNIMHRFTKNELKLTIKTFK